MKKEVLGIYEHDKQVVLKLIDTNKGRIENTLNMWTASNQKKGYMSIITHYIDNNWTLQNIILRYTFFNL